MDSAGAFDALEDAYVVGVGAFVGELKRRDRNERVPSPMVRLLREHRDDDPRGDLDVAIAAVDPFTLELEELPTSDELSSTRSRLRQSVNALRGAADSVDLGELRLSSTRPSAVFEVLVDAQDKLGRAAGELAARTEITSVDVVRLYAYVGAFDAAITVGAARRSVAAPVLRSEVDAVGEEFLRLERTNGRVLEAMSDVDLDVVHALVGDPSGARSVAAAYGAATGAERQGSSWLDDLFVAARARLGRTNHGVGADASEAANRMAARVLALEATGRHLPATRALRIVR